MSGPFDAYLSSLPQELVKVLNQEAVTGGVGSSPPFPAGLLAPDLYVGTLDAFGRHQVNHRPPGSPPAVPGAPAGILRLGFLQADGDAASVDHEGMVVYGPNAENDPMDASHWGLSRVKAGTFRLQSESPAFSGTFYRVDGSSMFYLNAASAVLFKVDRATGVTQVRKLQNNNAAQETVTVGPPGGAFAPPPTPAKYLTVLDSAGLPFKIPLYNP